MGFLAFFSKIFKKTNTNWEFLALLKKSYKKPIQIGDLIL